MTDDANNLVLRMLREMRAQLHGVRKTLDEHSAALKGLDRRMTEHHDSMIVALGIAGHANVRHDTVNEEIESLKERVERLEEKVGL